MKPQLLEWALNNREVLARHKLCGTGTTGYQIEATLNPGIAKISGPEPLRCFYSSI